MKNLTKGFLTATWRGENLNFKCNFVSSGIFDMTMTRAGTGRCGVVPRS
jgi:hypothetical protein